MTRIRYMLVDHHCSHDGLLHVVGVHPLSRAVHVPDLIHRVVPSYHWCRLDDNTIFVKANYYNSQHKILLERRGVTVLPATFSRQTVQSAIEQQQNLHHHHALLRHDMPYSAHTITADMVDWIAVLHGPLFDHDR